MNGDTEDIDDALGLTEASTDDLRQLADMITEGSFRGPVSPSALALRDMGHLSPHLAPFSGVEASTFLAVIRAVLAERRRASAAAIDVVWSGADAGTSYVRYTKNVVPEMIERARRRVTIAGYSFDEGAKLFHELHAAITQRNVDVRIFLDIQQVEERMRKKLQWDQARKRRLLPVKQARKESPLAFAEEVCSLFRELHWPYDDSQLVIYYDPRTADQRVFASLHAKCLIADEEHVLITSANFTGRGQDRNIEVGVVIHDKGYAAALERQWNNLVESGDVVRA